MVLFFISFYSVSSAQTSSILRLPIDSLLSLADKQAFSIVLADKQIGYADELRKKPVDLPKTSISVEYGNVNSAFNDTRFYVNQSFQFPHVYQRQRSAFDKTFQVATAQKMLKQAEVHLLVRQLCFRIIDLDRREVIVDELNRNFTEWTRIAAIQEKVGEINSSILTSIKIQLAENRLQKNRLEADRVSLIQELGFLLHSNQQIAPFFTNTVTTPPMDGFDMLQYHPSMQVSLAAIEEKRAQTNVDRNRLTPDLNFGYSNLSIVGWQSPDGIAQKYYGSGFRFGVYQFGMGVPIFNGAAKAKVRASKIGEEIAAIHKQQQFDQLSSQYIQLRARYLSEMESFSYYEKEGLQHAKAMNMQASARLAAGDIPFAEWALLVSQSLQISLSHAASLHSLQMLGAEFIYLTEKK